MRAISGATPPRRSGGFAPKIRRWVPVPQADPDRRLHRRFACFEARSIVEIDGATHGSDEENARDLWRDAVLTAEGFFVLRFQNDDVYNNLEGVLETIRLNLLERRQTNP